MHTAEHIINQAMCRLFDTGRSVNAHVERKKSRLDFLATQPMGNKEARLLEEEVNRVIQLDLPVTYITTTRQAAEQYDVDLSRIPHDSSEAVRIVQVGDYDTCLCIGSHVAHTQQIGRVEIYSNAYDPERARWRIRYRLTGSDPTYND
ncbi:Alanine--tRNA ligase [Chlamydia trachomatis]|nr:Alanine--tRNA ligase [Chlamydia trachomatis]